MALNDYWNDDAQRKAENFLRTGTFSDVVRNAPLNNDIVDLDDGSDLNNQGGCTSTSQCPAGYACVNGRCRSMYQGPTGGTSGGQWNNAGACDQDDPNSPCNQGGPTGCQSRPTCGDGDPYQVREEDCCDQKRCCSFGSASSSRPGINCYCGECPPQPSCSSFCAGYEAANGVAGPGCSTGNTGNSCNACTYCQDGQCVDKQPGPFTPCYCNGGRNCGEEGECHHCQTEPEEANFGGCVYKEENCKDCSTLRNHICSCGKILPPITICKPKSQGGKNAATLVREEARRRCALLCKKDCTDYSSGNLPEECKDCDCNCDNDCKECEFCNAQGFCEADPQCEPEHKIIRVYRRRVGWVLYCGIAGQICDPIPDPENPDDELLWTSGPIDADTQITTALTEIGTSSWSSRCSAPCPGLGASCQGPTWQWFIYFNGGFANSFITNQCNYNFFGDGASWIDQQVSWYYTEEYQFPD